MGGTPVYYDNYSPVGDLTVVAMCLVIAVLLMSSYVEKTRLSAVYIALVSYLGLGALIDVAQHSVYAQISNGDYFWVYALRVIYHGLLFTSLVLFVVYIVKLLDLEGRAKIQPMAVSMGIYLGVILTDIITTVNGAGFTIDRAGKATTGFNVFMVGHLLFLGVIIALMLRYGGRLYRRVMIGFYGTLLVSLIILLVQGLHNQSSFTTVSFLFPVISLLYLVHANTFDLSSGAADAKAFEDTIANHLKKERELLYVSLFLPDFDVEGATLPEEVMKALRNTGDRLFKGVLLYQISNGHMIFVAKKSANPDYRRRSENVIADVVGTLEKHKYNYKIVLGRSIEEISQKKAYISFLRNIHQNMAMNEIHKVNDQDVAVFKEYEYILSELADINKKKDLRDERVRVYCQPVFNIKTKVFDTAETLMRLDLPKLGIVNPRRFIPLAEEYGYIHTLTRIMLQKTCDEIENLMEDGYAFTRVSVNLSMLDLKEEDFTETVASIIGESEIPLSKVAFEITESLNEYDFTLIKSRLDALKEKGIKIYLDDFGTGFSNMERILELPFDIIKFDRSLVLASDSDERSEKMVGTLAGMFSGFELDVLYEGIESEEDEKRCIEMSASYLQGFKYSRPVPFAELRRFFRKA
ncbi:MAG: EAL domain-containing protein [Lachnospiraceae bacterium]|nr:EAL domain-containing protein [Lachnospiraceae bacterium]